MQLCIRMNLNYTLHFEQTCMHTFFFENGLQHAYIVSLQPMKHIYTAYIRIFFITFF